MSTILGYASNFTQQIQKLFANGEQGFFYDPDDLSTMFQDAAGTVPVTAAGQPVGLIRDKSGRNNHAYQTASASRPLLQRNATTGAYYLAFDGVDDFLQTNSIDFTATDRISVFAGLVKNTIGTIGSIFEFSVSPISNFGTFGAYTDISPTIRGYSIYSRGTITSIIIAQSASMKASLKLIADISQKLLIGMLNGVTAGSEQNQGTGNYGNYPLYIGRRGGSSLPFNGHLYSLIGIGRLTSDSETIALEKVIDKRVGVTLNV